MKPWSRHNTLYHSSRFGWLLHNALSGTMLELDDHHGKIAGSIRDGASIHMADGGAFISVLEEQGFLLAPEEEDEKFMEIRYRRNMTCFSTGYIGLSICPTLACNFACPYCFESSQTDGTIMSERTVDALSQFIMKHADAKHIMVTWYGGEPTLAFNVIEQLTERFIERFPDYAGASMVTNGYLLDQVKIDRLNDLRITSVQITLDGKQATHDQRRVLRGGRGTYTQILRNIDKLVGSSWEGNCGLRINIDRTNHHEYATLRNELLERYKGRKVAVFPGHVNACGAQESARQSELCNEEWCAIQMDGYRLDGIVPAGGFYPGSGLLNTCIATRAHGYVVGPKGELYKCWEDVGKQDMVIGSVHEDPFITNPALLARYTVGTDPFNDSECMACRVFPACGGGCVKKRMMAAHLSDGDRSYCSPLKEMLEQYLDAYMDVWHSIRIYSDLLGRQCMPSMEQGFRMVHPERLLKVAGKPQGTMIVPE